MTILPIVIGIFAFIELLNILMLYTNPESKHGNSLGFFSAYEQSKENMEVHALVTYLVYWVAGSKLIFIGLLLIIILTGNWLTQALSVIVLLLTTSTFFWKMYPIIRKMDKNNQLTVSGYSKKLVFMIISFLIMFFVALLIEILFFQ
jgi:hypothetical protein